MQISVDRNVVEITPENEQETASLNVLWRVVVDCYGNNKKIVPMGQFIPGNDKLARFHIEGVPGGKTTYSQEKKAPKDATYYCGICNKYMKVNSGQALPYCCGQEMEDID